jgi:predicted site-specific integrase-resolvase
VNVDETFSSDPDQLIAPKDAAAIFGVRALTVARWGKSGKVPTVVLPNGRRMYSRLWCEAYMREQAV